LILNNYHLGRSLLGWQVRNFDDSFLDGRVIGVIVTGLARSGTTALTMALERSKNFRSLDYSNMPFVLAPRFWRKYYNPSKSAEVSERSHGDGIDIGFNEVEALEEVFFINLLNGNYIKEFYLDSHLIPPAVNSLYRKYIKSIANGKLYLAKNNNFALRGESFLKQNSDIKVVVLFRDPLEQSNSLMEQHKRFIKLQTDDDFVLEYMNFIGHHEFGKGMKPFILGAFNGSSSYSTNSINFWLEIWLNYYSNILKLDGVLLVCYEDYCRNPNEALDGISAFIGITLDFQEERPFELKKSDSSDIDINLALKASELYSELLRIPSKYS
jgi:hypothetical protein